MPKKKKQSVSQGFLTIAMMSVIASSVVVTAAMTSAQGDESRSIVSYAGTSANPYHPITSYERKQYVPTTIASSKPKIAPAVLQRKIKQLERRIASVHKRIMAIEDKIDGIDLMTSDPQVQKMLGKSAKSLEQLENRLAKLNTELAELKMQQ